MITTPPTHQRIVSLLVTLGALLVCAGMAGGGGYGIGTHHIYLGDDLSEWCLIDQPPLV